MAAGSAAVLKLKVPSRLQVRVEPGPAALKVSNVAGLEVAGTRGEATFRQIAGKVDDLASRR